MDGSHLWYSFMVLYEAEICLQVQIYYQDNSKQQDIQSIFSEGV